MIGGAGNDTYVVDAAGDVVTEHAGEGTDTVQSGVTYTLGANVENLHADRDRRDQRAPATRSNNTLTGNCRQQHARRRRRQRHAWSAAPATTPMWSTRGRRGDGSCERQGTDTVQSSVSYTLGANVENLTLTGTGQHQRHRQRARQRADRQRRQQHRSTAAPAPTRWSAARATTPTSSTRPATW